jgi:hypothetical protein
MVESNCDSLKAERIRRTVAADRGLPALHTSTADIAGGGWQCCTWQANFSHARKCYGLAYASQRGGLWFGNLRKSQRIRMRLGGSPDPFEPFPAKPRRMHQRTYLRLRAQAEAAEALTFVRR